MATISSPIQSTAATSTTSSATKSTDTTRDVAANDAASSQDRFLKLLVAQLNNQDPMNPLDNAQMTSQIAQINTVTGIQQLNETVKSLASQFASQQLMQGTSMVGHQVLVEGDQMALNAESKTGYGAVELGSAAASVKVQVLDANNKEVGTVDMGALGAGRHNIEWDASKYKGEGPLRFKVQATNGQSAVPATSLALDQVSSVSLSQGALQLELARGGATTQSAIKAIL